MVFHNNGISEHEKTEVLYGNDIIIKKTLEAYSWIKTSLEGSLDNTRPVDMVLYEPIWASLVSLKEKGIKIRAVTEVTADNINYCKKLLEIGEFRHLDGIRTNFKIVDGKQLILHGISHRKDPLLDPLSQAILTNEKGFVEAHQYIFENLWDKAISLEDKIQEIEKGIKPQIIETITDPYKIQNLYLNMIKSALYEILIIIPTINAMYRQYNIGILQLLKEITADNDNNNDTKIKVRIMISTNEYDGFKEARLQNPSTSLPFSVSSSIHFRTLDVDLTTKSTIMIVDKKESLVIELKDDSKNAFSNSIGFATYSNSRATVLSFVSIFESFWKQSELVKKLKESEELQKDFVYIAAHELRTPIQPILGLSSLLLKKISKENDLSNAIKIINKNAKRLLQLTNDILDVTKIETNNLSLNKELFNLNDLISDIVEEYNNHHDNENIILEYEFLSFNQSNNDFHGPEKEEKLIKKERTNSLFILADKSRIHQVISNLLSNAIKFTTEGIIKIIVEKIDKEKKEVCVNVKDAGSGIDPTIIPQLFLKFTTKSKGGTGLGLFISKNIIEAHGGKIWGKNNEDEEGGATFSFSLPLVKNDYL